MFLVGNTVKCYLTYVIAKHAKNYSTHYDGSLEENNLTFYGNKMLILRNQITFY